MTDAHQTSGVPPYLTTMDALVKNNGKLHKELSKKILKMCEGDSDKIVKECFDIIIKVDGCGPFFSWQVTCDLHECHCLADSTENDWTKLGPGAKGKFLLARAMCVLISHLLPTSFSILPNADGIRNIFGDSRNAKKNLEDAKLLQTIQDDVYDALGLKFPKWNGASLTLKNIEHPLCEFSKYISIQNNLRQGYSSWSKRISKIVPPNWILTRLVTTSRNVARKKKSCSATSVLLDFAMHVLGLGMKLVITGFALVARRLNLKGLHSTEFDCCIRIIG